MLFEEAGLLLEPGYLPMETGYYRLSNGQIHVAVLTRMPGSKGAMVDWWFGYISDAETYRMWHPESHVSLQRDRDGHRGEYIGSSYIIEEYLGDDLQKLRIHFHDPMEFLDPTRLEEAKNGVAICANVYDMDRYPKSRVIHVVRDSGFGCEMRSRFWLFNASENTGMLLMRHWIEEMGILADFLPDLYARENGSHPINLGVWKKNDAHRY